MARNRTAQISRRIGALQERTQRSAGLAPGTNPKPPRKPAPRTGRQPWETNPIYAPAVQGTAKAPIAASTKEVEGNRLGIREGKTRQEEIRKVRRELERARERSRETPGGGVVREPGSHILA